MTQYQVFSRPRHLRYLFFIDTSTQYSEVLHIIKKNLRVWGGRYNPIIPTIDGDLDPAYLQLLKQYDPDYILYTASVEIDKIQAMGLFNPNRYIKLNDSSGHWWLEGLSVAYLLSEVPNSQPIIIPTDLWKSDNLLLDYFEVNFGITPNTNASDAELSRVREQIRIGPKEVGKIQENLYKKKPVNLSHLSARNVTTAILNNLRQAQYDDFELVIARDTDSLQDLLYFWNRHLFECRTILYITVDQLSALILDGYFKFVLQDMNSSEIINVISFSLEDHEIKDIIDRKLRPHALERLWHHKKIDVFPFEISETSGQLAWEKAEQPSLQNLTTIESLLFIPKLKFANEIRFHPQQWAIDVQLTEMQENQHRPMMFPLTTDTRYIIRNADGRILMDRSLTYYVDSSKSMSGTVEIKVPSFETLLHQVITSPVMNGETVYTPYRHIGPHDSSNRLAAFIEQWRGDFNLIQQYFYDKFWRAVFKELCTSAKSEPDFYY